MLVTDSKVKPFFDMFTFRTTYESHHPEYVNFLLFYRSWFWSQGLIRPLPYIKPSRRVWTTCGRYLPSSSTHEPFSFAMKMQRWSSGSKLWSILKVRDWALCCLRGKTLIHVDGKLLFCGSRFLEAQRTGKLSK